jgi:hypothetical protein
MAIWAYRGGISFSAGCLRQSMPGHSSSGLTNARDIMTLLHRFRIESGYDDTNPSGCLTAQEQGGKLAIVLTKYSDTNPELHWRLFVGKSNGNYVFNDPWGGLRIVWGPAELKSLFAGQLILIKETVPGWVPKVE